MLSMIGKHTTLASMMVVLLLAAAFRIYHITQQSLWFDEAFAWNIVIQNDMFPRIRADTHPPLYYVVLRGWVMVASDSVLSLRYLSALISLLTVAFVYRVGIEISLLNRKFVPVAAILAALILALSDAEIFLAQETRNYSLYTCLATLSMWMYLRWQRKQKMSGLLLWSVSTAALMYTHYQGAFIPAIQGLHAVLFLQGRQRWEAIGGLTFTGLLFVPWFLGVAIPQAQHAIDNSLPYAIPSDWETFLQLRNSYLGAQWALMLVLAIVGVYAIMMQRSRRSLGMGFLVVMWFMLPFSVLFFGNLYARLLTERKLLIVVPGIALMVGFGQAYFGNLARLLLVGAVVMYAMSAVDYYRIKEPWDQISGEIIPYIQATDLVMVEAGTGQYPIKYYWSRTLPEDVYLSTFPFLGDFTMAPTTDWFTYYDGLLPEVLDTTHALRLGDVATAWLVFWSQDRAVIERLEDGDYKRTLTITYDHFGNNIDIYRYDRLPRQPVGLFENGLLLWSAEIDADDLRVDLWWQTADDTPLAGDYTTSVLLLDANGVVVGQKDSLPNFNQHQTSQLQAGEVIYDPKYIELIGFDVLPPGTYTVIVQVYEWSPEGITNFSTLDSDPNIMLGTIER